jgi:hypothetical protein
LVTARQAAEEEGVTRKRLATKQCQGSVSYGVRSQATQLESSVSQAQSSLVWSPEELVLARYSRGPYTINHVVQHCVLCNMIDRVWC